MNRDFFNDDNIYLDKSSGELTFGKIFKVLKFSLLRMLVYILIACLIAGIICLGITIATPSSKNVATEIEYTYKGIDDGLDPSGSQFDKNLIKNTNVVKNAMAAANIKESDTLNINSLISSITVEEIIPDKKLKEILALKEDANHKVDANTQLQIAKLNPNRFLVSINNYDKLGLSKKEAIALLDELVKAHSMNFMDTFATNPVMSHGIFSALADGKIDYEYLSYNSLLQSEIDELNRFLSDKVNVNYKSSVSGATFSQLLNTLKAFENTEYFAVNSFIINNGIAKNKTNAEGFIIERERMLQSKSTTMNGAITEIKDNLAQIQPKITITPGANNKDKKECVYPDEYYELYDKQLDLIKEKSEVDAELATVTNIKTCLEAADAPTEEELAKANADLVSAAKIFINIADSAQQLSDEYNTNERLHEAIKVPVKTFAENARDVSNKLIVLIFAVAVIIAFIASISVTLRLQKKFAFKKLYAKEIAKEKAQENETDKVENDDTPNESPME